jgi:hypothetical protein
MLIHEEKLGKLTNVAYVGNCSYKRSKGRGTTRYIERKAVPQHTYGEAGEEDV